MGSSSTNRAGSSAPAGDTPVNGSHAVAQFRSNQARNSNGQQSSASSYSARRISASASQNQSYWESPGHKSHGGSAPAATSGCGNQPPQSDVGSAAAPPGPAFGSQALQSTASSTALPGSSSTNRERSSASPSITVYGGYSVDQFGSNQSPYSYRQQSSAISYSCGSFPASAPEFQSFPCGTPESIIVFPSPTAFPSAFPVFDRQPPAESAPSTSACKEPPVHSLSQGRHGMVLPPRRHDGSHPGEHYNHPPYAYYGTILPNNPEFMHGLNYADFVDYDESDSEIDEYNNMRDSLRERKLQERGKVSDFSKKMQGMELVLGDFGKMLASGEDSDVTVQVGDVEFKIHKFILYARSPVFSAMLRHDTAESASNKIIIEDCEPEVFRAFLQYLYTGSVQSLTQQNVFDLYKVADKYLADNLKEQCLEHLRDMLSVKTFCNVVQLALKHGESGLLDQAFIFANENIHSIICTAEWKNFIREHPTEANDVLIKSLGPEVEINQNSK